MSLSTRRLWLAAGLLLLAGCFRLSASEPQDTPVEGTNHLIIRTVNAPQGARQSMAQVLREHGFSFDTASGPTIVTDWRPTPSFGTRGFMKVSAFIENEANATSITLRGRLRAEGLDNVPITNDGLPGSVVQKSFAALDSLAQTYPGGEVFYAQD